MRLTFTAREVAAQLQAIFNNDDCDEPDRHEGHSGDMHFLDKMNMWRNNAEQDHSAPPNTELFEGVQDDDEDPIDQSKLSAYHKIILDSTAYKWFLKSAAIEASVNFETSLPRIRQQILDKLPTGTVSKLRSPKVYEVKYSFEWQPSMGDRLQDMFSEVSQRSIRPIRSSIVMTGSPNQAQGLTIKQYLAQTWPEIGLQVLDALLQSNAYPNSHYCGTSSPTRSAISMLYLFIYSGVVGKHSIGDSDSLLPTYCHSGWLGLLRRRMW